MTPSTYQETRNLEKYERAGLEARLVRRFGSRLVAEVRSLEPRSVLDAGCGEGVVAAWLADALPQAAVTGADAREEAVREFARRNPGLEVVRADVYALPFADGSFDLVVATEVLEHLDRPRDGLAELARVSSGHLLLTVPHEPFFRAGNVARGRYLRSLGSTPGHRSTWGRRSFERLVETEVEVVRRVGLFPWQGVLARVRS